MTERATFLQPRPPRDGKEYDVQCGRCGSTMSFVDCGNCEDGLAGHECWEDCCMCADPDEDNVPCGICGGRGGFSICLSSEDWCQGHPLDGRANVLRSTPEWFEARR